ncbi:DNA-directed DNA polymerase [Tanacetum coccineum]
MTRSSTKELFTPFKEPEREFQSSRKLLKTLSLDESRSLEFNLFSDLEEYFEEEVAEIMAETMEQYMSKTRADYESGIVRPKIDDKNSFELKGQFLKELRDNTFSGSDHEDANEHIEKVLEIVDLFHIPNITQDQVMLRAFPIKYCPPARTVKKMEEINNFQQDLDETLYQAWERFKELLMKCSQHYLTEMQDTVADAKVAIQEMAEYSKKWHNGTSRTRSTETYDGLAAIQAQLNNLGREIKKVNKKVYAAQVRCEQCKGPHYTKDCPLKEEGKTLKEAYYTQFGRPFQGGGYRAAALGFYQRNNANPSYQERRQSIKETLSKLMSESAKRHEENSNMIKEIRASTDAATTAEADSNPIRHIGSPQYAVSTPQNRRFMFKSRQMTIPFPSRASVSVVPLSTYLNLGLGELAHTKLIVELADRTMKNPKGIAENMLVGIGKFVFPVDFITLDMPEDVKLPLILGRPFLSTAHAKIDVFKRKITLRVGDEKIIFKSVKPASSLIKRVYMLSLRERIELDLEARLMGETLVRDQVDDLMPTIEEGEVIDEPMIDIIKTRNNESFDEYPSFCDFDRKIHIDCAYNLRFSCMIGFKRVSADFFQILSVNMMSMEFYNSIIKDKVELKGKNVVGAFMNVPIFVRNFSVVTRFLVVENIDGYRDQDMGDIILGNRSIKLHVWKQKVQQDQAVSKGPRCKEIDKVGEVSIIWNPMCDWLKLCFSSQLRRIEMQGIAKVAIGGIRCGVCRQSGEERGTVLGVNLAGNGDRELKKMYSCSRVICGGETVSNSVFKYDLYKLVIAKMGSVITYDSTRGTESGEERFKKFANNSGVVGGERFCFNTF